MRRLIGAENKQKQILVKGIIKGGGEMEGGREREIDGGRDGKREKGRVS